MILKSTFWYLNCKNRTPPKFQGLYPHSKLPWDGFPPPPLEVQLQLGRAQRKRFFLLSFFVQLVQNRFNTDKRGVSWLHLTAYQELISSSWQDIRIAKNGPWEIDTYS